MGKITNIVFTKNRPLQLDGYLSGLNEVFGGNFVKTVVLYKPELFGDEYRQVFTQFNCNVVNEKDFHQDLLDIIKSVDTEYILFGIDDVVYFDKVDWKVIEWAFADFGKDLLGFSFRFDIRQMDADKKADNIIAKAFDEKTIYTVDWTEGQTKSSRYPFELCATIYRTEDIKNIIKGTMSPGSPFGSFFKPSSYLVKLLGKIYSKRKLLKSFGYFFNPNTFESWCCRYVQQNKDKFGRLLAFERICASAIQVNMVNTSTDNAIDKSDELTVESLNEKYKQGWRIDIEAIKKLNIFNTHGAKEHFIINKIK